MAWYVPCSVDVGGRALGMERNEVQRSTLSTRSIVLTIDCMIEKLTKPRTIGSTGNFWTANCSTWKSSEDSIDGAVVKGVVLGLRTVPVWDIGLVPDLHKRI
jgi:hypothetical protein